MVQRYHLHSDEAGVPVPRHGHGLVQSLRAQLATVQYDGCQLLPGSTRRVVERQETADFNTDQGSQFTSLALTGRLKEGGIRISMDGRRRALDNIFIERLWRSVKYQEVYLREHASDWDAGKSLRNYFKFYCNRRTHQALAYRTPAEVYRGAANRCWFTNRRTELGDFSGGGGLYAATASARNP